MNISIHSKLLLVALGVAVAGFAVVGRAAEPPAKAAPDKQPSPADKPIVTYAQSIKPIFDEFCVKCHTGDKPKAGVQLDSLEAALKGGKDGKVIEPGDGAGSKLVSAIAHHGKKIKPLTEEQTGLIRTWIDQGAK